MRTFTLLLTALLSLTVLLSSANGGMAMDHPHMQSHGPLDQNTITFPSAHDTAHNPAMPSSGHSDMCGMVLCGPFMPLALTASSRKLDIKSVTYLVSNDLVQPFSEDLTGKPPRF
ncbi:hypothetical protein ACFOY8_22240 [Thalassospira xianhensis]|uniref:DUF2946 domain-containing protein n=1 Tax=Thalassospira xianhensis MCCC 1A02616 TaxID=1177929 RepID=A0A367UDW6_9PROT|nr:hypothetical protein [Thalassospira xianhensis]RCK06160.1 hypothetical protein TH5_09520 [Thalassospira xianhensis MCCC 1A02616]UKV14767.1 hypothetical protein L6172_00305 [Thalassospiraceae bacterium SW-3-3]